MTSVIKLDKDGEVLLGCEALRVGYHRRAILPPINFSLKRGEIWAVVGRNGAGKSTWFRTLLGLVPAISGKIYRTPRLAYIPQRTEMGHLLPLDARDVVQMGIERNRSFLRPFLSRSEKDTIAAAMAKVEIDRMARHPFGELSEGQKQRVLMARMLVGEPDAVVLDEPTASMDQVAEDDTLQLVQDLVTDSGLAVLIVSHSLVSLTKRVEHMVLIDRASQTFAKGTTSEITTHPVFCRQYHFHPEGDRVRSEDECDHDA